VEALCAALGAPRRVPRVNVGCARKRVLDYSTRTSARMPIVFPKRATMIVTPAELDGTTPCGAPALGRPEWDAPDCGYRPVGLIP
jgi:hypothetical protein